MIEGEENKISPEASRRGFRIDSEIYLAGCILAGILFGWIGLAQNIPAALVTALMLFILALVTGDLVWSLDYRRAGEEAEDDEERKSIAAEQVRFDKLGRPIAILVVSIAFVILTIWAVLTKHSPDPESSKLAYIALVLNVILGGLMWWIGPRVITNLKSARHEEQAGALANWSRIGAIILWLSVPAYIGSTAADAQSWLVYLFWFGRVAGALEIIISLELLIRSFWSLVSPRSGSLPSVPIPTILASALQGFGNILLGKTGKARKPETRYTWLGGFLARSVPRVVIGLMVILWLASSITQVGLSEQGVRERFGAFTGEILEPGIHIGWPWPIDRVQRFPSRKLQVMEIGFTTESSRTRADLIWTEAHGIEEDRFVTASGNEVISFDIELYYTISDVREFAYTFVNPETQLMDIAYQAILLRTHATDTDSLLSRDRAALAQDLREDIQANCEGNGIGVKVELVAIIAIHPPFEVADDYQAVVSAEIHRDTLAIQASTYSEEIIPSSYAYGQKLLDEAGGYAAERVATATGEAQGFISLVSAVRQAFDLYRFRRRIEALETCLNGKRLYIVNGRFLESEEGEDRGLWFDLR